MKIKFDYIDLWDPCGCRNTGLGLDITHRYWCDIKENDLTIMLSFFRWCVWVEWKCGGVFASKGEK